MPSRNNRNGVILINTTKTSFKVITSAAKSVGWGNFRGQTSTNPGEKNETDLGDNWNVLWSDLVLSLPELQRIRSFQKVNHFPGTTQLSRKYRMARKLAYARARYPSLYNFYPDSWALPAQMLNFSKQFNRKTGKATNKRVFIVKPDGSCMGRGIYLASRWKDIKFKEGKERYVAQKYIPNPLLIEGYKFDLRVYVLVISVRPLVMYLYQDGLVRLCTRAYKKPTQHNIKDNTMHLTNYSINKFAPNYINGDDFCESDEIAVNTETTDCDTDSSSLTNDITSDSTSDLVNDKDIPNDTTKNLCKTTKVDDVVLDNTINLTACETDKDKVFNQWVKLDSADEKGSKRSVRWFNRWLQSKNGPKGGVSASAVSALWDNIADVCVKTFLLGAPAIFREYSTVFPQTTSETRSGNGSNCFELLGFDILIDRKLKPWLLEINASPSMNSDTKIDRRVKGGAIHDIFEMLGTQLSASDRRAQEKRNSKESRRRLYCKKTNANTLDLGTSATANTTDGNIKNETQKCNDKVLKNLDEKSGNFHRIYPPIAGSKWSNDAEKSDASRYTKLFELACKMESEHGFAGMTSSPGGKVRQRQANISRAKERIRSKSSSYDNTTKHQYNGVLNLYLNIMPKQPKYAFVAESLNSTNNLKEYANKRKSHGKLVWEGAVCPPGSNAMIPVNGDTSCRGPYKDELEKRAFFQRLVACRNVTPNTSMYTYKNSCPMAFDRPNNSSSMVNTKTRNLRMFGDAATFLESGKDFVINHTDLRRTKSFDSLQNLGSKTTYNSSNRYTKDIRSNGDFKISDKNIFTQAIEEMKASCLLSDNVKEICDATQSPPIVEDATVLKDMKCFSGSQSPLPPKIVQQHHTIELYKPKALTTLSEMHKLHMEKITLAVAAAASADRAEWKLRSAALTPKDRLAQQRRRVGNRTAFVPRVSKKIKHDHKDLPFKGKSNSSMKYQHPATRAARARSYSTPPSSSGIKLHRKKPYKFTRSGNLRSPTAASMNRYNTDNRALISRSFLRKKSGRLYTDSCLDQSPKNTASAIRDDSSSSKPNLINNLLTAFPAEISSGVRKSSRKKVTKNIQRNG